MIPNCSLVTVTLKAMQKPKGIGLLKHFAFSSITLELSLRNSSIIPFVFTMLSERTTLEAALSNNEYFGSEPMSSLFVSLKMSKL